MASILGGDRKVFSFWAHENGSCSNDARSRTTKLGVLKFACLSRSSSVVTSLALAPTDFASSVILDWRNRSEVIARTWTVTALSLLKIVIGLLGSARNWNAAHI